MYDSLMKHAKSFHLYVFAFDQNCFEILSELNLPNLTPVSLRDFEDPQLLSVKTERSRAEYCWTCTSSTIRYVLQNFPVDHCIYIDADMQFFHDPHILLKEMAPDKSVLITPHNYTPYYDQSGARGRYCVQFMYFRKDECGLKVLGEWREDCLDWCYARVEDGKFGDQKYLDSWQSRYNCVHELKHKGGGIAPWNCQQYDFEEAGGKLAATWKPEGITYEFVFFHFHGVKLFLNHKAVFAPRSYQLGRKVRDLFYKPYLELLLQKERELQHLFPGLDPNGKLSVGEYVRQKYLQGHFSWIKRNLAGRFIQWR